MAIAAVKREPPYTVRKFTVDEYYQMARVGILREDDRVELIEGEIVVKSPISSSHAACVDRLTKLLSDRIGDRAILRVQNPIRLSERSEPEPDLALLKPRQDFYRHGHPSPEDVLLVVEVAETSLPYDREVKIPLYSRHGVREVWLVDLQSDQIEICHQPSAQGYQSVRRVSRGERLAPEAFPDLEPAVDEVLG
jgi:Uma2 family endonuclease